MLVHLQLLALLGDLLLLLALTVRRLSFHLLPLHVGLFRRVGLALGFELFLLGDRCRGLRFALADHALLAGLQFFALRLRGALLLLGLHFFFLGAGRGGLRDLLLPHRGGVGLGLALLGEALLLAFDLFNIRLRRAQFLRLHFLLLRIRLLTRSRLLFAQRTGVCIGLALPRHPLLPGLEFVRLRRHGSEFLSVHFLLLNVGLFTRGPVRLGSRLRRCGGGVGTGRVESSDRRFSLRLRAAVFARLHGGFFRLRRRDHHGILHRFAIRFRTVIFYARARVGDLVLRGCSHHGIRHRILIERFQWPAGHRGRIAHLTIFPAPVFTLRARRAAIFHGLRGVCCHRRGLSRRDGVFRDDRWPPIALAARPFAGENRRHRVRVGLHGHHLQIRRDHRFRRRGVGREPFRFALKMLPQIVAHFSVFHTRPARRHTIRGENALHFFFQKRGLHRRRDDGRIDDELIAHRARIRRPAARPAVKILPVEMRGAHEFQRGDGPLATAADDRVARPAVVNHRHVAVGVVGDVGDVHRVADDRHIARMIHDHEPQHRRSEIAHAAEIVKARPDVADRVHPCADADLRLPVGARRQRRPADVVVAVSPRNPARPPLVIRLPDPAHVHHIDPAPVVIDDARKLLVAHPRPARIGESPVAIRVRHPVGIHVRRPPAEAVARDLDPLAVGQQRVVEIVERNIRGVRGARGGEREQRGEEEKKEGFEFHGGNSFGLNGRVFIQ